ncbi:hypothetical protein CJJ07_000470 [Candidozyma auris]|nr:hypothetical protein CJJ07_000470 [[Candida] auris]QEL62139.1 hypothetical protein CJJ09_004307 [[Candida] auris]
MSLRPRLISLDAFAKTVEDARVKTASGGMITLICVFIVLLLIRNEYNEYTSMIVRPELVVDRDVNKQLDINLDITFPNVPCGVLTLDILDNSGDLHLDVLQSGFEIFRVLPSGQEIKDDLPIMSGVEKWEETLVGLSEEEKARGVPCGSCYGAVDQTDSKHCCNSCKAVRLAYAVKKWAFYDGENIEQCEKEGYVQNMKQRINDREGCRVKGSAKINRISGNLHFAPGIQISDQGRHSHDMSLWRKYENYFNIDHKIHHFSFGKDPSASLHLAYPSEDNQAPSIAPLDGFVFQQGKKDHVASYYLSVVSTRFEYLEGKQAPEETNQFSVITHDRPVIGGRDDDHQNTMHARGGVPGTFFHFDISPMKIINRQEYAKTWSGFVLGVISSIAGVLTVGAVLDRSVWAAEQALKGKKDT